MKRQEKGEATRKLITEADLRILAELEKKVLWLSSWTIHHANHIRESNNGVKVGGHQASSASLAAIMTALYFHVLRPQDRVAVKPHASPNFHAIQYLLGQQTREKLEAFRVCWPSRYWMAWKFGDACHPVSARPADAEGLELFARLLAEQILD